MEKNIEIANAYYNDNLKNRIPGIIELDTNKLVNAINRPEASGEITPIDDFLEYFTKSDYLYTDKLPHQARNDMFQIASIEFPEVKTVRVPLLFGNEILLVDLNNLKLLLNEKDLDITIMTDQGDSKKSLFAIVPYVKEQTIKKH